LKEAMNGVIPLRRAQAALAGAASLFAMLTLSACSGEDADTPAATIDHATTRAAAIRVTGAAGGYAPDNECTVCHSDIARTYADVGMARSLYLFDPQSSIEDFVHNHFYHANGDRHYEMSVRDGTMYVARYQVDSRGGRFNEFEAAVDWVIGSGNHVRSYMFQTEAGELYQMPISWYAGVGWRLSPGFDAEHPNDFSREVTRECMFCHNAYPDVPAGSDRFGEPDVFPANLPHGIGCQRCHGPGAEHIRVAERSRASMQEIRDSIINPARLDPARRDDVCMQCHLQPSVKLVSIMRRFGESEYAYRPGDPLHEHLLHFDIEGSDPGARFEINHHPFRLFQSACYVESGGAMSCMTCHDPHVKVRPEERLAHYRAACLSCHQTEDCNLDEMRLAAAHTGIAADDCVSCHMGPRVPTDVTHAVMTDHLIQKRPPPLTPVPVAMENEALVNPRARFYERGDAPAPSGALADVYKTITLTRTGFGDLGALRAAAENAPDAQEIYWYLGQEELASQEFAAAERTFARAAEIAPDRAWPRIGLAKALQRQGKHQPALAQFRKALDLTPNDPEIHLGLARSLGPLGRTGEAHAALEEAIRLRSHYAEAFHEVGLLHAQAGEYAKAETAYTRALAIEPGSLRTARDLGMIHMHFGRFGDVVRCWRAAADLIADSADLRVWLAQVLLICPDPAVRDIRLGDDYALQAQVIEPQNPAVLETRALAHLLSNRFAEAQATAEEARAAGADEANALLIRAVAQNRLGRRADAASSFAEARSAAAVTPSGDAIRQVLLQLAQREIR